MYRSTSRRGSVRRRTTSRPPSDAFLDALYGGLTVNKYVIVLFGYAVLAGLAGLLLGGFGFVTYLLWLLLRSHLDRLLPDTMNPGTRSDFAVPPSELLNGCRCLTRPDSEEWSPVTTHYWGLWFSSSLLRSCLLLAVSCVPGASVSSRPPCDNEVDLARVLCRFRSVTANR